MQFSPSADTSKNVLQRWEWKFDNYTTPYSPYLTPYDFEIIELKQPLHGKQSANTAAILTAVRLKVDRSARLVIPIMSTAFPIAVNESHIRWEQLGRLLKNLCCILCLTFPPNAITNQETMTQNMWFAFLPVAPFNGNV